jgi:hypothetical protein
MNLNGFQSERRRLLSGLPPLAWQRHPFTNDCSARRVFGSHDRNLFLCSSVWTHARRISASSTAAISQGRLAPELKFAIFLPSDGNSSVFLPPLRTGAAHIVRLGPIPVRVITHCGPPRIRHGRARLRDREGENVCNIRELSIHRNPPGSSMYRATDRNSRWNPPRCYKCKI